MDANLAPIFGSLWSRHCVKIRRTAAIVVLVIPMCSCTSWGTTKWKSVKDIVKEQASQASDERSEPGRDTAASLPKFVDAPTKRLASYSIGRDDEIEIKVYDDPTLDTKQVVRPDGRVAVPLVGEIEAAGLSPEDLKQQVTRGLNRYFTEPQVTVIVTDFKSRRVSVIGEVQSPGVFEMTHGLRLLDAVALSGGITRDADRRASVVYRDGDVIPVDLDGLIRRKEFAYNIALQPNDMVIIPTLRARALVLGEVKEPKVVKLDREGITALESITIAGGFSKDADPRSILVVRGGLEEPTLILVDATEVPGGETADNVELEDGDIVFVSQSTLSSTSQAFEYVKTIISTFVVGVTGIVLAPDAWDVLTTGETQRSTSVAIPVGQ